MGGRGMLNPMIVVQAQVFQVVNRSNSVMYAGSTTGPSHNNAVCSPYAITWHVDKVCHRVSPEAFDNLCKEMKDTYNLDSDLYPHGSRKIVSSAYVAQSQYVITYA